MAYILCLINKTKQKRTFAKDKRTTIHSQTCQPVLRRCDVTVFILCYCFETYQEISYFCGSQCHCQLYLLGSSVFGTRLSRALADKTADGAASAQQTMEKHKIWLLFCGTAARKFRKGLIRNAFVITVSLTAPD